LLPKMEDPSKCLGCGFCEAICPDFGICVISSDGKE
jgi:NAD-dependent dihydropyrimidine dehydrogenase PreA subunit